MQKIQRSFTSGELDPSLHSRADISAYTSGLAKCENFIIKPTGGAYSRAGFRFVGDSKSTAKVRLIPFKFNFDQQYVLVFSNLKVEIIFNGAFLKSANGFGLSVPTPYTSAQLAGLDYTQSADVMTLVHINHPAMSFSRIAALVWAMTVDNFSPTILAPATVALSLAGLVSPSVGRTYRYVVTSINNNGLESLPSLPVVLTTPALSPSSGIKLVWSVVPLTKYYRVYKEVSDLSGFYGWIGDSKALTMTDYNLAPISSDSPPSANTPFSLLNNYPSKVAYYQQRRLYSSSTINPSTVWASVINDYKSLRSSSPVRDSDSLEFTLAGQQVNDIRHMIDSNGLLLLTGGGVWRVSEGVNNVFSARTISVRQSSTRGSSHIKPSLVGSSVVYIQSNGRNFRDLRYEYINDRYQGADLSIKSQHMFETFPITEMTYSAQPNSIIWSVRSDGVLIGLTYFREQNVLSWFRVITDGIFESVTSVSENGRDALYVSVNRVVGGLQKRYVERLEPDIFASASDSFCVDSGLSYAGVPVTIMSGLTHLEGRVVSILADGAVVGPLTVLGGSVTLPFPASKVSIGLPYTCVLETLDIDVTSEKQTLKGKEISISKVVIEVYRSRGGFVGQIADPFHSNDATSADMIELKPRFQSDGYGIIPLRTFKDEIIMTPEWNKGGGLRVEQRDPLPLNILSITPDVHVGGV